MNRRRVYPAQAGNAARKASTSVPGCATTKAFGRCPSSGRIGRTAASRTCGCSASTCATQAANKCTGAEMSHMHTIDLTET